MQNAKHFETFLAVLWLRLQAPNAGGKGLIPGLGTRIPSMSPCPMVPPPPPPTSPFTPVPRRSSHRAQSCLRAFAPAFPSAQSPLSFLMSIGFWIKYSSSMKPSLTTSLKVQNPSWCCTFCLPSLMSFSPQELLCSNSLVVVVQLLRHVLHYLPEFAQTRVHWVGDAIQSSHPLSAPSPVFSLSQHQGLFQWIRSSHQVTKVLELQHQSFQWIFRVDFL